MMPPFIAPKTEVKVTNMSTPFPVKLFSQHTTNVAVKRNKCFHSYFNPIGMDMGLKRPTHPPHYNPAS